MARLKDSNSKLSSTSLFLFWSLLLSLTTSMNSFSTVIISLCMRRQTRLGTFSAPRSSVTVWMYSKWNAFRWSSSTQFGWCHPDRLMWSFSDWQDNSHIFNGTGLVSHRSQGGLDRWLGNGTCSWQPDTVGDKGRWRSPLLCVMAVQTRTRRWQRCEFFAGGS